MPAEGHVNWEGAGRAEGLAVKLFGKLIFLTFN